MRFHAYDSMGFLVGWYEAEQPRPNSTVVPPPYGARSRWNGEAWVEDASRELASMRHQLLEATYTAYADAERRNLTPAGSVQLAAWSAAGRQRALDVRAWVAALYAERDRKLAAVEAGDLTVDPTPSQPWKPWTFREIAADPGVT